MRDKTREAMRLFLGGRCYTAEKLEKDYLAEVANYSNDRWEAPQRASRLAASVKRYKTSEMLRFIFATIAYDPGFAPIFPDICYHLTHYKPAAADIPVASDNPAHYADAIRYNARTPLQGSLLPLTRLVWA